MCENNTINHKSNRLHVVLKYVRAYLLTFNVFILRPRCSYTYRVRVNVAAPSQY